VNSAKQMRSYKLTQFGAPLKEILESPPTPIGTQVLLRVSACGVCHSDIHLGAGYFDLGAGRKADMTAAMRLPRVLGHEILGVVEELGLDASGLSIGDRRVVYPWGGCGECRQCRAGQENLCAKPNNLGIGRDGGFSNYILVDHPRYLFEFDPLPDAFAATLACSGLTAYSALKKAAPVDADNPLLIIGAGGLGLAAVNLARAIYGVGPVVADIDATKRQAALRAGASAAVDPTDPEIRQRLTKETGGFAAAIDFVGAPDTSGFGLAMLRKGGRMFIVGLFGGLIEIPLVTFPSRAVGITGVLMGSLPEFRELLALARQGQVNAMPIETRPLDAVQESLDDLQAGRISGRVVLTP
jgi:D-arabinose 1-dehydrogenase-like Zn-dependent alcohol dehydrogenase